jgi:hypothetical protein
MDTKPKLRLRRQIDELAAAIGNITFPRDTPAAEKFRQFTYKLRELLRENIGYSESHTLEWDETNGAYYMHVTEVVYLDGFLGTLRHTIHLDPRKSLNAEIERLQVEVQAFKRACGKAYAIGERAREEAKAARALKAAEVTS